MSQSEGRTREKVERLDEFVKASLSGLPERSREGWRMMEASPVEGSYDNALDVLHRKVIECALLSKRSIQKLYGGGL